MRALIILVVFIFAAGVHRYLFGDSHFLAVGIYNGVMFSLGGLF